MDLSLCLPVNLCAAAPWRSPPCCLQGKYMTPCFCTDIFGRVSQTVLPLSCIFMTTYITVSYAQLTSKQAAVMLCWLRPNCEGLLSVPLTSECCDTELMCAGEQRERRFLKSLYVQLSKRHTFKSGNANGRCTGLTGWVNPSQANSVYVCICVCLCLSGVS